MTDDELAAICALLAAVTPLPWGICARDGGMGWDVVRVTGPGDDDWEELPQPQLRGMVRLRADAALMAHAPALLAVCCEEIERLRTALNDYASVGI